MQYIQDWIVQGYVDPNLDDAAFTEGRVALSWSGHWKFASYCPRGDCGDVILLPLPDFGHGSRTGQGSWCWTVTRNCAHPERAMEFLEFLLRTPEILAMTNSNHAVPGTKSAVAASADYGVNGPLHLFAAQLQEGYAVPRPRTPAYPIISSAFQKALLDIRAGGPVAKALQRAARVIDRDLADNHGYRDPRLEAAHGGEGER
jgi:multiple sugar transport system substrate-binding protein